MGSICPKKIPPYEARSVTELAEKVVDKIQENKRTIPKEVKTAIETSCAGEFWAHWRLKDKNEKGVEVNKKMFLYLVLVIWLERSKETRGKLLEILTVIKEEFFIDPDMVECVISFQVNYL